MATEIKGSFFKVLDHLQRILKPLFYRSVIRGRKVIEDFPHQGPHTGSRAALATSASKRYMSQKVVVPERIISAQASEVPQ